MNFDELFGKTETGTYLKWNEVGDAFAVELLAEPDPKYPQKNFSTGKTKYLVREVAGGPWKPKDEGTFDPDQVDSSFMATVIAVKVNVYQKSTKAGKVDDFEPFETLWELSKEQTEKLKEEMVETGISFGKGTKANIKFLIDSTPRKFSVKLKAAE